MTTQRIQIQAVENKKGIGKKTGNAYEMDVAQVVVVDADGKRSVGEMVLPKGHPAVKVDAWYSAITKVVRTADGKIQGSIESLVLVKAQA